MDGVRTAEGDEGAIGGDGLGSVGVDGRSRDGLSVAGQGPYDRLRELRFAGWLESTQQGTPASRGGESLRGRWVGCRLAVRRGVEWLAAGPWREWTGFPRASAVADAG